jgi:glycosyltransferase involved in cell wall biosynthesis
MAGDVRARRLLVSAFGINSGGGLVLFNALLPAVRAALRAVALDTRLRGRPLDIDAGVETRYVRRGFLARFLSLNRLARQAGQGDVLFCFNSLPPLSRSRARVVNYVHAPHFVGAHRGIRYSLITRLRTAIERRWFHWGIGNCDEIWVQTDSMARALAASHPAARVSVVPFVDDALLELLPPGQPAPAAVDAARFTFFYPADTVGHKNHSTLLAAWLLLARENCLPKLQLTIDDAELREILARVPGGGAGLANVVALGRVSRQEVLDRTRSSSALLFPSLAETLGIPLVEAVALGTPVLASERDFTRDVCVPRESFDPSSPRSIADAVRRFMGAPRAMARFHSAADVAARLLA